MQTKITYKTIKDLPIDQLDDLIEIVGWGRRGKEMWEIILSKSSTVITAWSDNKLVGLGRTLEDGVMCMVYDIAVHPEYQGNKIGTQIMQYISDDLKTQQHQSIGLFAWDKNEGNIPFYNKFGFEQVDFGMKLIQKKEDN